jgi:transposase
MKYSYLAGIDISKNHLDICLMDSARTIVQQTRCANRGESLKKMVRELPVDDFRDLVLVGEHTGMYGHVLRQTCRELGIDLWMEDPAQIKASLGRQRGKSDPVDAVRIACYGMDFPSRLRLVKHSDLVDQLARLQSERTLLVADRAKYKGQLRDQKDHMSADSWQAKALRLKALIKAFDEQIESIEQTIEQLIRRSEDMVRQYSLLQSIPGVGPRLAVSMIVATAGFTRFDSSRAFCCYSGVAPFGWHSGTNTYSGRRVSHRANKHIKSLLHMGAMAAVGQPGELRQYYQRKCEQGKPKMSVLNAVRGKLVHRMFAIIKLNENYIPVLC